MEEKKIEILIFCIVYNNHTIRFIKNLKKVNPNYIIDTFTLALDDPIPQEILDNVRCCYKLNTNVKNIDLSNTSFVCLFIISPFIGIL